MDTDVPRFRFVPASTQPPDLGHLHTAVFNWALARALGGDFILRMEDGYRDGAGQRERETGTAMTEALRWLGLDWDEGPDLGGPHAPYLQSRRQERYGRVAERLVATENAYYDEDSAGERALYLRLPRGEITVAEALRGTLRYGTAQLSAPVLLQADGQATSLLAEVVDDREMGVTHVARRESEGALSPLQAHLFRVLAWDEPVWIHLPAIADDQGRPLDSEILASDFREAGYLPEAVFNFLLLLGWSPDDDVLDKWKVRKQLKLEALSPEPAVFRWERLNEINRHYLRDKSDADLVALARPFLEEAYDLSAVNEAWLERLIGLIRDDMSRLDEAPALGEWALTDTFSFSEAAEEASDGETARASLVRLVAELAHIVLLDEPTAAAILDNLRQQFGEDGADLPVRAALTGRIEGPPLAAIMALLGKQRCLNRIAAILRA